MRGLFHLAAAAAAALIATATPALSLSNGSAAAHPDFTGTWDIYPAHGQQGDPRWASPPIPDPVMKPEYMAHWKDNQAKLAQRIKEGQPAGDNYVLCIPDGMPAMMQGMFPMEIIQLPSQVNITQEAFNQTRRIYMNEKLPRADEVDPSFFGRSVGHWEGDTLVIETTGIKPTVEFHWTPHSENMKITERLHIIAPDILRNDITIEDDYLARPWIYAYSYKRMPGYKMQEYVCEDNRDYVDENGKTQLRIDEEK